MSTNPLMEWSQRIERMEAASYALAQRWAVKLAGYARQHASWKDRFGHARAGLFGQATRRPGHVGILLSHTMAYGVFLESPHKAYIVRPKRGRAIHIPGVGWRKWAKIPAQPAKYAIIVPTFEKHLGQIGKSFEQIFRR